MIESDSRAPRRLVFIDVLRLIAAVQMIQGHSVDAVLAAGYRHGLLYQTWSFLRGLTSVIFLVTAGLAFVLAEARGGAGARRRRARRALMLISIGYLMHAPFGVLFGSPLPEALSAAVAVDVLQCIGVSLLALELLTWRVGRTGGRVAIALAASACCFLLAPVAAQIAVDGPLRGLANYATTRHGSLFPLVPWAGYVFAGFGLGQLALRTGRSGPRVLGAAALAWGGLALVGRALEPSLTRAASPAYCALKLACVLALCACLMYLLRRRYGLSPVLARLASETLFLYVSHVVVLYADHIGLVQHLRGRYGPGFGIMLTLALLFACGAAALATTRLRSSLRAGARGGTRGASS